MKRFATARLLAASSTLLLCGLATAQTTATVSGTTGTTASTTTTGTTASTTTTGTTATTATSTQTTAPSTATSSTLVTTASTTPTPESSPVQQKLVSSFTLLAGSEDNAASLVRGLRTGSRITLVSSATQPASGTATGASSAASLSFDPPTQNPMGWGNVRHALTLAQRDLAAHGIGQPSASQLQAALLGGSVTTPTGPVTLSGTLTLRSQGMGWGQVAHRLGVPLGNAASVGASRHDVPSNGYRYGTVTNGSGEVVRTARWSGQGGSHARIDAGGKARTGAGGISGTSGTLGAVAPAPTSHGGVRTVAHQGGGLGHAKAGGPK